MMPRRAIGLFCLIAATIWCRPAAGLLLRTGPAEEPDRWPDWGGTPDLTLPAEVGLSPEELDGYLTRMAVSDRSARARAVDELVRDVAGSEAVLRARLFSGHGARNAEMRDAIREARRRSDESDSPEGLIKAIIEMDPADDVLGNGARAALQILAMLRALASLDTLAAYKAMIDFSPRHAGGFRHDIGKLIVANGMSAMPALIYGRGSDDKEVRMFSVKWIRDMGSPLLSDQVKIENPRRLAQLLEAYASVNELDAIDVTLSLTNHRSAFVRAAARSALAVYGRNAFWPARRRYENAFGDEPSEALDVSAILDALYRHFDNQRLAKSKALFAEGQQAHREGDLAEMDRIYKAVLKSEPMFPKRDEMAAGFLELAASIDETAHAEEKLDALMMARRVSPPESETAKRAHAELMWLRSRELRREGLVSRALYERILEHHPSHGGAREMLEILNPERRTRMDLFVKAVQVSFVIFLASALIFLRLRRAG